LFPFTSHNLLRFSASNDLGNPGTDVAHAFIEVAAHPDRYVVRVGSIAASRVELETANADQAAEVAERLLAGWWPEGI
jgi:hypothetical protein